MMYTPLDLYDSASARTIDAQATALLGGNGYLLMQRAGQAACELLLSRWPQARRIAIACGTGNNGGDGYVLARLLLRAGRKVRVVHLPDHGPVSALAQRACTEYLAAGGGIELFPCALDDADVLVDALFGIGLDRAPDEPTGALIRAINQAAAPVLALDVPSGVDAVHGVVPGAAVRAELTLQFIVAHLGLYSGDALEHVGERLLHRLDVPASVVAMAPVRAQVWGIEAVAASLPPRRLNTHKGESGRVLCIGGNNGTGGAVILAAEAALRCGAGLVQVLTRSAQVAPLLARCPEVMAQALDQTSSSALPHADVLAVGPGLGQDDWARGLWQAALAAPAPKVVDADALNLLAASPQPLPGAVMTPHPGEAGRLLGISARAIQHDRIAAAQTLAQRFDAVVVLKGAGTIVAAPRQTPRILLVGNPGMATGGMGDLLTGVIAALIAQGQRPFQAATLGALLHGAAGDAAACGGERGLLPRDLLPELRRLVNPALAR